jgi:trans-aconitate methyltransferase
MTRSEPSEVPLGRTGWAGDRYAAAADHHRSFDDWFLAEHPPRATDQVVDAGCGSGEFSRRVARLVPQGRVLGIEPDGSMLAVARQHEAPNLEFRPGRLQDLDRACGPSWADLVVSRAVLHWIPLTEYRRCFEAVRRVLRPGGWFHAESGGTGNVQRLRAILDEVADRLGLEHATVTLPDAGVVLDLLEEAGFEVPLAGVSTVAQRRSFDRDDLLDFIRTQAAVAYGLGGAGDLLERFVGGAGARLEDLRHRDGTYDQTFVRLHLRCRRPPG